jgi:TonB family protein
MFDYAISSNKGRQLTGRTLSSYFTSGILHFLLILALIEYPDLLRGGMYHRFRTLSSIAESLMSRSRNDDDQWRTVTVLQPQSKMMAPSASTLKHYLYDWNKKDPAKAAPPIRIRFGDEQKSAINHLPPMPQVRQAPQQPELTLPANALASGNASTSSASGQSASGTGDVSGRQEGLGVTPLAPAPAPKSETAETIAPKSIPSGIKPPASPPPTTAGGLKVFETEQKAIHSPDSGIFDTKGFPLGEYVNVIKERIKGNWFIPSNLQNFQGHTTIIFYIDRLGRYANARIVARSGSNSFDNAALMAVITSDPFPPLPESFPGNHIGAKFVLSWNEP